MALTKISGSVIKDSVSLSGNVSVGGTLTYQDVTNVDALGIGTFRTGIKVLAGQVDVGNNIKLGNAGVITATSFVGSGANLTSLPSQIGGAIGADFNDNVKLRLGTGNDLSLFHDSNRSAINNSTGELRILSGSDVTIGKRSAADSSYSAQLATFKIDGAVELYHNNVKRFETDSTGVRVVAPEGARAELRIIGDEGDDNNDYFKLSAGDGTLKLQDASNGSTWEDNIVINGAGSVELYYDNVKKAETTSSGLKITTTNSATAALQLYNTTQSAATYTINGEGNSFIGHTYPRTDANLDLGFHSGYRWRDVVLSGGIRFGSANAVNYLSHYETGQWVPEVLDANGSNYSITYTATECRFVRIGNLVYAYYNIRNQESGSKTGDLRLRGFPGTVRVFQVGGQYWIDHSSPSTGLGDIVGGTHRIAHTSGHNEVYWAKPTDKSGIGQASSRYLTHGQWTNGRWIYGSFMYEVT